MTDTRIDAGVSLTERLRPYAAEIEKDAVNGDVNAKQIIKLHQLHIIQPNDPAASGLCEAAFFTWHKLRSRL